MWALAAAGAVFAMLPGINELLAFGSVTFLAVFGLINHFYARIAERAWERWAGQLGTVACFAAVGVVFVQLAVDDPAVLALIAGCLVGVAALRFVFERTRPVIG